MAAQLGKSLEQTAYISDIDLDVFRTRRAVMPDDPRPFRRLIAGAKAITIARDRGWVERLWLGDEEIARSELGALVLDHI